MTLCRVTKQWSTCWKENRTPRQPKTTAAINDATRLEHTLSALVFTHFICSVLSFLLFEMTSRLLQVNSTVGYCRVNKYLKQESTQTCKTEFGTSRTGWIKNHINGRHASSSVVVSQSEIQSKWSKLLNCAKKENEFVYKPVSGYTKHRFSRSGCVTNGCDKIRRSRKQERKQTSCLSIKPKCSQSKR